MKKLSITLLLALFVIGLSSCDSHFWSPLSGSRWYSYLEVQGNYERDIYEDDASYMEISFYGDGTGEMSFWYYDEYDHNYHWVSERFDWDDRGECVEIYYHSGGPGDIFYYEYHNGRLRLSESRSFINFIEFCH